MSWAFFICFLRPLAGSWIGIELGVVSYGMLAPQESTGLLMGPIMFLVGLCLSLEHQPSDITEADAFGGVQETSSKEIT